MFILLRIRLQFQNFIYNFFECKLLEIFKNGLKLEYLIYQ